MIALQIAAIALLLGHQTCFTSALSTKADMGLTNTMSWIDPQLRLCRFRL